MKHELTEQQFLDRFQNTDFVLKTQSQIAKDFERQGHESHPDLMRTALSLEDLNLVVEEMLTSVVRMGEPQTLQLLYIIDIPQAQFLSITTDVDFFSKAAAMIIRREAKKVYLRSIY